ncbi:MAG: hypothetical protein JXR68_01825, partial [Bacteroidales bacterium]|nr:hypothetical protein [Bacteroidales bacterium]
KKDSIFNSTTQSYTVMCKCVNNFFNASLKSGIDNTKEFIIIDNQLIQKDTTDYTLIAQLLNQILQEGIDSSITEMKSNEILYKDKTLMINIVGRMFLGNENDIAKKIFTANTEIHPDSWEGFYNQALAYKENNQIDEAKNAIVKAKNINNNNENINKLYDEIIKMN